MVTEIRTIWARVGAPSDLHPIRLNEVGTLIDEGWELVDWQAVSVPPRTQGTSTSSQDPQRYDVFLLKRNTHEGSPE